MTEVGRVVGTNTSEGVPTLVEDQFVRAVRRRKKKGKGKAASPLSTSSSSEMESEKEVDPGLPLSNQFSSLEWDGLEEELVSCSEAESTTLKRCGSPTALQSQAKKKLA